MGESYLIAVKWVGVMNVILRIPNSVVHKLLAAMQWKAFSDLSITLPFLRTRALPSSRTFAARLCIQMIPAGACRVRSKPQCCAFTVH